MAIRTAFDSTTRRIKVLRLCPDALMCFLKGPVGKTFCLSANPIPDDVRVVGIRTDERGDLHIGLESESFPELLPGSLPNYVPDVYFTRINPTPLSELR